MPGGNCPEAIVWGEVKCLGAIVRMAIICGVIVFRAIARGKIVLGAIVQGGRGSVTQPDKIEWGAFLRTIS